MGQRIVGCAASDTMPWKLVAAIERPGHPRAGFDAGVLAGIPTADVAIAAGWECLADVVIDFSLPEAVAGIVSTCVAKKVPLVVATTGLEDSERRAIAEAAKTIPILQSPSMSLAVNVAMDLVGAGWDDMVVKMGWMAAFFSIWLGDAGVVGWFQAI